MPKTEVRQCECHQCQSDTGHGDRQMHKRMNLLLSRLDEQQRRWYAAVESTRIGQGGDEVMSQITGLDVKTIRRGRVELEGEIGDRPAEGARLEGGGRWLTEKKTVD